MAAKDHLQLKLFYTAGELMDIEAGDSRSGGSLRNDKSLRDGKLQESVMDQHRTPKGELAGFSLHDSIARHGVKTPVSIGIDDSGVWLSNGHHRVVSANAIDPDMYVPHEYYDEKKTQQDLVKFAEMLRNLPKGDEDSGTF
jgi:hypothetical protein